MGHCARAAKLFPASAMPDREWWQALWPDPAGILRTIGIVPGTTVVDLCCGDGYFTAPLAVLVDGKVHALDLDAEMLRQARAEVSRMSATVLQWIHADARDLAAYIPEPVDVVFLANTFHGVFDKTALARSVARVLEPTGRFAIVNWHALPREQTTVLGKPRGPKSELRMSPVRLQAVVEPVGFYLDQVCQLPPYHYGAIFRKRLRPTTEILNS